jgi:hypothetical protein
MIWKHSRRKAMLHSPPILVRKEIENIEKMLPPRLSSIVAQPPHPGEKRDGEHREDASSEAELHCG